MMRANGRKVRMTGVTRLLFVLLALIVAVHSLSVPAVAADRVVGNPNGEQTPPAHGVNAVPEGAGSSTDLKVEVIDTMSRYAVDLIYDSSRLTVSPGERIWNVNTLQYEYEDKSEGQWFANHRIEMTVTNYSDMGIIVEGAADVYHADCGYNIKAFSTLSVDGAFVLEHGHDESHQPVKATVAFTLSIPSWTDMAAKLAAKDGALDEDSNCTLGTITLIVRPNTYTS